MMRDHNHRLAYSSRSKAQQEARRLGLETVHSHQHSGKTLYMPGRNHTELSQRLRERGLPPAPVPGSEPSQMDEIGDPDTDESMFGMELGNEESPKDPLNLDDMGMQQDMMDGNDLFGFSESEEDDDDTGGLY